MNKSEKPNSGAIGCLSIVVALAAGFLFKSWIAAVSAFLLFAVLSAFKPLFPLALLLAAASGAVIGALIGSAWSTLWAVLISVVGLIVSALTAAAYLGEDDRDKSAPQKLVDSSDSLIDDRAATFSRPYSHVAGITQILSFVRQAGVEPFSQASEKQYAAISDLGFGDPPSNISAEEAHYILSARNYARAVVDRISPAAPRSTKHYIIAHLIQFISSDPELLQRAQRWSARSFARGRDGVGTPRADRHWKAVIAECRAFAEKHGMKT